MYYLTWNRAVHRLPDCMTAEYIKLATLDDELLGILLEHVLCGWPSPKVKVQKELQPYYSFRHKIVIIDGIAMKDRRIIIPALK